MWAVDVITAVSGITGVVRVTNGVGAVTCDAGVGRLNVFLRGIARCDDACSSSMAVVLLCITQSDQVGVIAEFEILK